MSNLIFADVLFNFHHNINKLTATSTDNQLPILCNKLKQQLYQQKLTFSYQFNIVGQLGTEYTGGDNNRFYYASDVKVSYQHNIIVVSDCGNKRIQFFALLSREYLTTLKVLACPVCMCVDGDDLYVTTRNDQVVKYNIKNQLATSNHSFVWQSSFGGKFLNGIAMSPCDESTNCSDSRTLFVCDTGNNRVVKLNPINGKLFSSFNSIQTSLGEEVELQAPLHIAFNDFGECFISSLNRVFCIRVAWIPELIKTFTVGEVSSTRHNITLDRDFIIICCCEKNTIAIRHRFDDSFSLSHACRPYGLSRCCLDVISGELLVVDDVGVVLYD